MENREKLAKLGTQDEEIKNKNTTQHLLDTTMRKHTPTHTHKVNKTWSLLQPTGGKSELTIVLCGNRNGHHNTELRTWKHRTGRHKKLKRWPIGIPPKKIVCELGCSRRPTTKWIVRQSTIYLNQKRFWMCLYVLIQCINYLF